MKRLPRTIVVLLLLLCSASFCLASEKILSFASEVVSQEEPDEPFQASQHKLVFSEDFSTLKELNRKLWKAGQNSRWSVEDGYLKGMPSTKEYQDKKLKEGNGHLGDVPRVMISNARNNIRLGMRIKYIDGEFGKEGKRAPFFDIGHHEIRVYFTKEKIVIEVDSKKHDKVVVKEDDFILKKNQWYEVGITADGESLRFDIQDDTSSYSTTVEHDFVKSATKKRIAISGAYQGTVHVDDIKIWNLN